MFLSEVVSLEHFQILKYILQSYGTEKMTQTLCLATHGHEGAVSVCVNNTDKTLSGTNVQMQPLFPR